METVAHPKHPRLQSKSRTILVVDDDVDFLCGIAARLGQAGYNVLTAATDREAMQYATQFGVDAITLDVRMPGNTSGFGLATMLREDPQTADIPIIFLTGVASEDFKARCQEVGVEYFLCKPYDPDLLMHLLDSVLNDGESMADS